MRIPTKVYIFRIGTVKLEFRHYFRNIKFTLEIPPLSQNFKFKGSNLILEFRFHTRNSEIKSKFKTFKKIFNFESEVRI